MRKIGRIEKDALLFANYVGSGEIDNEKRFSLLTSSTVSAPIIQYQDKYFILSWDEILILADEAGLFKDETQGDEYE